MSIKVEIKKQLGNFCLNVHLQTDGNRIGILGASGCGKSMTLKSIAGIERPDSGQIIMNDKVLFDSEKRIDLKPQKRQIGYLFQNYALFPTMNVCQNIAAGLHGGKWDKKKRVNEMVQRFDLNGLEDHLPGELSGGQQQRVALARIMAYEPDVILLDEPFSALDIFLKDRLQQEMQQMLADYRGTVILVSHSRDEIYRMCDELLVLDQGRDICFGKTKEIFQNPLRKEAATLSGCKNIVPVIKKGLHTLEIPDWGTSVTLSNEIPEDVTHLGFRAHDFIPHWEEGTYENRIPFVLNSMAELPFERKFFIKAIGEQCPDICWFVDRTQWERLKQKGEPSFLSMPEDKILLLR